MVFTDFLTPPIEGKAIATVKLAISLAAYSAIYQDKIRMDYWRDNAWHEASVVDLNQRKANSDKNEYLLADIPDASWEEISVMKIRLSYENSYLAKPDTGNHEVQIYLDALWLQVEYVTSEEAPESEERPVLEIPADEEIGIISDRQDFKAQDEPRMRLRYRRDPAKRGVISKLFDGLSGLLGDSYEGMDIRVRVKDPKSELVEDIQPRVEYASDGQFDVWLPTMPRQFRPGEYRLVIEIDDNGETVIEEERFTWGVLAYNSDKAMYQPGETALLQMAVLTPAGNTVCTSDIRLEIVAPDGGLASLSTSDGSVVRNPDCGADNKINTPDYYAYYQAADKGIYRVKIIADYNGEPKTIEDIFEVGADVPFSIQRTAPTRINPSYIYRSAIDIVPNKDYAGEVKEYLPKTFRVVMAEGATVTEFEDSIELSWTADWKKGRHYQLAYFFDAPDVSPEFYLLGPLRLDDYQEARAWQIASDADMQTVYANQAAQVSDASGGAWTTLLTAPAASFTASNNYFVYLTAGFTNTTNANNDTSFRIWVGSNIVYTGLVEGPNGNANEVNQIEWFDVIAQPTTATSVSIDFNSNGGTAYGLNAQIIGLNLSNISVNDWTINRHTANYTHTNAFADVASTTLPGANGLKDWLVFAKEHLDINSNTEVFQARLTDGAIYRSLLSETGEATNELMPYVLQGVFSDVASGTRIRLQVRDNTAGSNAHATSAIFAINLNAFESSKAYHHSSSTWNISNSWSGIGSLNNGGNYTPINTGDQVVFASWFDYPNSGAAYWNDRLLVNSVTVPTGWNWDQANTVGRVVYSTSDVVNSNVFHVATAFPSSGQPINLEAIEVAGTTHTATETSIAVFSTKLAPSISLTVDNQYKDDGVTAITNGSWTGKDVRLAAYGSGDTVTNYKFYFELLENSATFTSSIVEPGIYCSSNTAYDDCSGKIWGISTTTAASSSLYLGKVSIPDVPESSSGYKWQVMACDQTSACTYWNKYNLTTPNFKVDAVPPGAPGNLVASGTSATSLTLNFGASSTESFFDRYRVFYKAGISGVTVNDSEYSDSNLLYQDYNGASGFTLNGLEPSTQYVVNIWAYDLAGNKTSAAEIAMTTDEALPERAKTAIFLAGKYSGNGTVGQNSDTDQSFASFNIKLAEPNVTIKDAYIEFESHFEAYVAAPANNYTGYKLSFDACADPCSPNPWTGTSSVSVYDNSVLAYRESGAGNQVRLHFDVASEAQLASYTGGNNNLQARVGYRLERNSSNVNSLSDAKALLYVTYTYPHENLTQYTNTVIYPLESTVSGHSGTRLTRQADDCTLNSTCPTFTYKMDVPDFNERLMQWFNVRTVNDANGGNDIQFNVNIQGTDLDSVSYFHESNATFAGEQGSLPQMFIDNVSGYAENATQTLEMHPTCSGAVAAYDLMGGEVFETYIASATSSRKIRTVSFPIGVIGYGNSTAAWYGSADVRFPENGSGAGNVRIKKAWIRYLSHNYAANSYTATLAHKVGTNATSSSYVYNYSPGSNVIHPTFMIYHVLPASEYAELELANKSAPKTVLLSSTAGAASQGVSSGELMVTYEYADDSSGYLTSLRLFAGQPFGDGATTSIWSTTSRTVFPEIGGTKTLLGAALLASRLESDSDYAVSANWSQTDVNISSAGVPICTNTFYLRPDGINAYGLFYKSILPNLTTTNDQTYYVCHSYANSGDTSGGAKMGAALVYTYQWVAPPPSYSQSQWRWYNVNDSIQPGGALAGQNYPISNINIGEPLRLRLNAIVSVKDMATSTQSFKLQYSKADDCASATNTWASVGQVGGTEPWIGYNNATPLDGDLLASVLLSSSTVIETYEEANDSFSNPNAVPVGTAAEWDWSIYDNGASSTSRYCFRMALSDGSALTEYLAGSYPYLDTAASNTPPSDPASLGQYKVTTSTAIANQAWSNDTGIRLFAETMDVNLNEILALYYEFIPAATSFTTATTKPASPCPSGTAYGSCASRIWYATSTQATYKTVPFRATSTITSIPGNPGFDYKWQVLACDKNDACSAWSKFGLSPNVRIDTQPPSSPGRLAFATSTPTTITMDFGASTTEANFSRYRVFYRPGTGVVTELNIEHADNNALLFQNYGGNSSTTISSLSAGTSYSFDIWAYDLAGNKASSTIFSVGTTTSSFTAPTGGLYSLAQKTDGSGAIDIVAWADDADNDDNLRAELLYATGTSCDFTGAPKLYLDPTDANTTADYGDPKVDNAYPYQLGTSTGFIWTSPGVNYTVFDWLSKMDIPDADGTYCVRYKVNDGIFDQAAPDTKLIIIDNIAPTAPGSLTLDSKKSTSVTLNLGGSISFDNRFKEYKIFYKAGASGVTESDSDWTQADDVNLGHRLFNGRSTTTITGLTPGVQYVFNIWAYDNLGNNASSTVELVVATNAIPANPLADQQFKADGSTMIPNNAWTNENDVVLRAKAHDYDPGETINFYYQAVTLATPFLTATTAPASPCSSGTAYGACASKVWSIATTTYSLPADWYGAAWPYRKRITINASRVPTNETNFTVLATTTDSDLMAKARGDGYDILFTSSDGTTELSYEREYYSSSTGQFVAWVRTDISSTSDTILYMYYGNPLSSDHSSTTAAWSNGFSAVWHLDETVVDESTQFSAHRDSTANANHAGQYGNNELPGLYSNAQDFDGNDYASSTSSASLSPAAQLTIIGWTKRSGGGSATSTVSKLNSYGIGMSAASISGQINANTISAGYAGSGWHQIALTYNSGGSAPQQRLFLDGTLVATGTLAAAISANSNPVKIGDALAGQIDEVSVAGTARSDGWIKAAYNNQSDVSTFLSFASESRVETMYADVSIVDLDETASGSGYKWQIMACDSNNDCSSWSQFNPSTPNFKVDTIIPTAPGQMSYNSKDAYSVTLNYGASTTELNFDRYRVFYSTSSPVTIGGIEVSDANLLFKNYNSMPTIYIDGLVPSTPYYFNIWAYDQAGWSASSTAVSVTTNSSISTPGVMFYAKNTRIIYYKVWDGTTWSQEQTGPTVGAAGAIHSLEAVRSDDGARIALVAAVMNTGPNPDTQQWFALVYNAAANTFDASAQLGATLGQNVDTRRSRYCIGSLSGKEFFVVKANNDAGNWINGSYVHRWNKASGWNATGVAGPDNGGVMNYCRLYRRPNTDNYLLMAYDDNNDLNTAYYYGGSTFANTWTAVTEHSNAEYDISNFPGSAFIDSSDNTLGAIAYEGGAPVNFASFKKMVLTDNSVSFSSATTTGAVWTSFVHSAMADDPGSAGIGYFIGADADASNQLHVYKIDVNSNIAMVPATNGSNISNGLLYPETNDAQKPFDIAFYRDGRATIIYSRNNASDKPYYRLLDSGANSVDAANTLIADASSTQWTRVRTFKDPNSQQFYALFQNTNLSVGGVFFDGGNNRFYNSANNPGSAQNFASTSASSADRDFDYSSFAYATYNQPPNTPTGLAQYKVATSTGTTTLANGAWMNSSRLAITGSAIDPDASSTLNIYFQVILNTDSFSTSTSRPSSACPVSTLFSGCSSKIWVSATSSSGDYSLNPYSATMTIQYLPDSSSGYKWQVMACDTQNACSGWTPFSLTQPNFKVDTTNPTSPGPLSYNAKTSTSANLNFNATTTEVNFLEYRIYYKAGASGVAESDSLWGTSSDPNLGNILYNGTANTQIASLTPSTQYVFNIWAYDQAGNKASGTSEYSTTTNQSYVLTQRSYRLENDDGSDANNNTAAAGIDTSLSNLNRTERLNLRIQVDNTGGDTATNKVFRLQFENQTDAPGAWNFVTATSAIRWTSGLSGSNNDILTSSKAAANVRTWKNGSWHENTAQTSPYVLENGRYTEFAYAVSLLGALNAKTYRFRLYNDTDSSALLASAATATISIIATDNLAYSKEAIGALGVATSTLAYPMDPAGYSNVSSDNGVYDTSTSSVNFPVFLFARKNSNNTNAVTISWNGQSSQSTASSTLYLQVYRYGATNAWVTIASHATSTADTDFTVTGNINSNLSQYYDGNFWVNWRVYQASGNQALRTDYVDIATSTPIAYVSQNHYRWRNDDGSQAAATWREAEDAGSPTASTSVAKLSNIRLRFNVANTGGGAANYQYRLQYATTTNGCSVDTGTWTTVPAAATSEHWEMTTSANFADGAVTTAQMANAEGYVFVAGRMVEDPSNTTAAINLAEGNFTEVEYQMYATNNAITAGSYCFRVTNAGAALNNYTRYAELTVGGSTNSAPYFTVSPSDGGSATTTLTSEGSVVAFSATAGDAQGDVYYLAICQTNSITAGNNAAPTCNGGSWCISNETASGTEATCDYTAATTTETGNWYAFACDKKSGLGNAKCTAASQGDSGTSEDSPFNINHRPAFSNVATVDNFKNPGQTFTISTVSSDTDALEAADTLYLYVCRTNSASFAGCTGGAGDTVCSAIATSSPNARCSYTAPVPSVPGPVTYYAFLYDSHGLSASANSRSSSYSVNNVAPSLGALILNDNNDISLYLKGTNTPVATYNTSVSDDNGCSSLVSAVATVYMSNATSTYNCSANDNYCYQIPTGNCAKTDCSGASDTLATYTCTTSLKYFAAPTDDSTGNPLMAYGWMSYLRVFDGVNYSSATSSQVELNTAQGIDVIEPSIDFGVNYYVGENSGTSTKTTNIMNVGNSPFDANVSGTNMAGNPSGTINVNNIEWELTPNFNWSTGYDLLTTDQLAAIHAVKPSTSSVDVVRQMYWGIGIPFSADAAIYNGLNVFTAVLYSAGW